MIDPPDRSVETEDGDLPVTVIRATDGEISFAGEAATQGFQPCEQSLSLRDLERAEVIEAGLPELNLIGVRHVQGLSSSCLFASSSETQPWRSGALGLEVASSHSPLCFIRSKVRNAASSRCSSGRSAALSAISSAKDMPGRWHEQRKMPSCLVGAQWMTCCGINSALRWSRRLRGGRSLVGKGRGAAK